MPGRSLAKFRLFRAHICAAVIALGWPAGFAAAQELEPRAYAPLPTGANFFVVSIARSAGSVLLDPSVPVTDVHATSNAFAVALGRSFGLFGRQALIIGALPYATAKATGRVQENSATVTRSGLADARFKLSVVLAGSQALGPAAFAKQPRRPTFGVSLAFAAPTGQYDPRHLVNIGGNRWAYKPEVGLSYPRGKWTFELASGAWFYLHNPEFFPGTALRTQGPIGSIQGHVGYSFRRDIWLALDSTWYAGGRTDINGVPKADFQRNSRVGLTFAMPVAKRQSLKFAYSAGAATRIGGDFDTASVSYQYLWFDKPPRHKPSRRLRAVPIVIP